MAYAVAADCQRLVKWITFGAISKLTTIDIEALITEADAQINGMIGQIYTIPVTALTDVVIVKYASVRLAAYAAAKILISQAGGDLSKTVEDWKDEADKRIADIQSRKIFLENTPTRQVRVSGLYSHTAHDVNAPAQVWHTGKDEW